MVAIDREHLHCHILFNSVPFVDGANYKNTFKDYFGDIRGISNEVSRKVRSSKKLRGNAGDPMCPPPYG